jgi:hypothetical protein
VNIEGIPYQWLTWKVMARVASALGVMVNVDWPVIFKSFYRKIRLLIAVRDIEKIPPNKLFEMEQCFFLVTFDVEKPAVDGITIDEDDDNNGDEDQQEGEEDAAEEQEDGEELGGNGGAGGVTGMDTEMATPRANGGSGNGKKVNDTVLEQDPVTHIVQEKGQCSGQKTQLSLEVSGYSKEREAHVMSRLIGELVHKPMSVVIEQKSLEENVGTHLLQRFDEESEEDEQPISTKIVSDVPVAVKKVADKGKKAWGPIQATRMSSRIARDGKSAIEKAQ